MDDDRHRRTWIAVRLAAASALGSALVLLSPGPARGAQVIGQFLPQQAPAFGVGVNGGAQTLNVDGVQYPLPGELEPVAATTIQLMPGRSVVASHRTPEPTDTCGGDAVQHMYHRLPAQAGDPLTLVRTVCLDQPRAFQGFYDQAGLSPQLVATIAEIAAPTSSDQRVSFLRLDVTPGVDADQAFPADVESVRFSPSGTVALVKYDLPGGMVDPADYRFIDLCPATFGQTLATYADVGAGAAAAVEDDGSGGYRVRFSHPGFLGGATVFPIADCLGAPPPPPPGEQVLAASLTGNGSGRVTSTPAAIDCPTAACQAAFPDGSSVTLLATAERGSSFAGWSGDCSGTQASAVVTMDQARQCVAGFSRPAADLDLSCTAATGLVAGTSWSLSFTVANAGPGDATDAELLVSPGVGLAFDFSTSSPGCFAGFDGTVACRLGLLASSEQTEVTVSLHSDPLARGSATFAASAGSRVDDPVAGNSRCERTATLEVDVDLALDKDAAPDPVGVGELLVYTLEVENRGRSGATAVVLSDPLPPEVTPVALAAAGRCEIASIFPGASVTATLLTRVADTLAPGAQISNSATVSAAETDRNPGDNTDGEVVTVASAGAPAPSGFRRIAREFVDGINDLSVPAQSGSATAFFAQDGSEGVFLALSGRLLRVYSAAQAVPGRGGGYVNIGIGQGPTLDGLAQAWFGQYNDTGAVPARLSTLVSASGGCTPEARFDERVLAGGSTDPDDWLLLSEIRLGNGRLAFASSRQGSPLVGIQEPDGSVTVIANGTTPLPGAPGDQLMDAVHGLAFDGADLVFHAGQGADCSLTSNGCAFEGLYLGTGGGLVPIADSNTPIPGGSGTFRGFFWDSGQLSLDGGQVVFLGYDDQRRYGIYLYDGSTIRVVADRSTALPGSSETFDYFGVSQVGDFDFPDSAPALRAGTVAFAGGAQGATRGLYLWRSGKLQAVIELGASIAGDRIDAIRLGPESLGVDRLAFWASAAEGQSVGSSGAIYTIGVDSDQLFASGFEPGAASP